MPRPWRKRHVNIKPETVHFKPNVKKTGLEPVVLHFDELESIRLQDFADFDQKSSAQKMKVPTTTFQRTLNSARKKVAEALISGKEIIIEDRKEVMDMPGGDGTGPLGNGPVTGGGRGRGAGMGRGAGRGRGRQPGGYGLGPGGECVCPSCNTKATHQRGVPCYQIECPKCGTKMVRTK